MKEDTMSPRRRLALLIVAGAHLGLVAVGACKVHLGVGGPAKLLIEEYGALSGAENFYSFFASDEGGHLRPIFEVMDSSGGVRTDVLNREENLEVDVRIRNLISLFWGEDLELRRALMASWADVMFARHPGAKQVVVRVETCDLPRMAEFREGQRAAWQILEKATFSKEATR